MSGDLCTGRFSFGRCTVVLGLKKRLRAGSWPGYEIAKDSTTRPREINIGDAAWRCVTVSKRNLAKKRSHHTCTSTSPVRVLLCSVAPAPGDRHASQ